MIELLKRIKACPDRDSLLDMLGAHFREQGFEGFGYMVPSTEEPGAMVFELRGLPEAWRNIYRDEGLSKSDPFPQYVARHRHPIQLSDVWKSGTLTPAEREFVGRAREGGITDGFLIPTFGSHQQMGIFALGQVTGPDVLQRADIDELQAIMQAAHTQLDRINQQGVFPRLAPREVEILHWIAHGKTNSEIASILNIGLPTVSTYIQRLFAKLEVNDRSAAAVKGVKFGIISV